MGFEVGLVDPRLGGHDRWARPAAEPLGVGVVGDGQRVLPVLIDRVGGAECTEAGVCQAMPECRWM